MIPGLFQKASLFHILHQIDIDLSNQLRQDGCPYCGGSLHQGNYERKPRGGPDNIPDEYMIRQSLCCGREGCRKRSLPPSCLFMGRRVYFSVIILVVMTIRQNRPDSVSARKVKEMFGISRKTLKRWIAYFKEEFPYSKKWRRLRGRIDSSVTNDDLPSGLVNYFLSSFKSKEMGMIACLRFLS